jgi:NADH dehydrogenase FAD-containing subunit
MKPVCSVANQQGKYIAKKLNKIVNDQEHTKPFQFNNKGSLAYIGNWCAVSYSHLPC